MPWEQTIEPGTTVLTLNHAAMFDPTGFVDPNHFDPQRNQSLNFLFGHGHHQCLGRHIGAVIIPKSCARCCAFRTLKPPARWIAAGAPFRNTSPCARRF